MYTNRFNEAQIYKSFETTLISAVLGARRVGKTTLVEEYARRNSDRCWAFINMDHYDEKRAVQDGNLLQLVEEISTAKIGAERKIWVIIDEAQKCPEVFDQVKYIYDKYKDQNVIKFILTGSGHLPLHQLSAESLAGRIELFHLREFGLKESLSLIKGQSVDETSILGLIYQNVSVSVLKEVIEQRAPFRPSFLEMINEQLLWGGLPEILKRTVKEARIRYLRDYLQTYLEKDIRDLGTVSDLDLYRKLMDIMAEQTGSVRHENKIKEALGCARETLTKYRGYLMATMMYQEVYPYIGVTLKRVVKAPKGYLFDNGLISYLTGIDDINSLKKTGQIGHRFENWFLKELAISLDREVKRHHTYYWRTSGGVEVDFIVEIKPNVFPFEVTYSQQIDKKKLRNLKQFLKEQPKAVRGYYIYMGNYYYNKEWNICFIPAWAVG
jgi:predicted AAA+ superfamily ATPase